MDNQTDNNSSPPLAHEAPQQSLAPSPSVHLAPKPTGRTGWDMLLLFLERRASRPPTNWYRVAFWLLLCAVLVALYFKGNSVLTAFHDQVGRIQDAAESSKQSAGDAAATASKIEKTLQRNPAADAQWVIVNTDQAACDGNAVQALTRVGASNISTAGTNWFQGTMSDAFGTLSLALIGCTPNKIALFVVSDWDEATAGQNRDKLVKAFVNRANSRPTSRSTRDPAAAR